MIRALILASAFLIGGTATIVQADVLTDRKAAMKALSKAAKPAVAMMKGKAKFDLAVVKASLKAIGDNAKKSQKLYPASSAKAYPAGKGKGKSRALPLIWEKMGDFDSKFKKLSGAAYGAMGRIKDLASLKANMPGLLKNCGGCHKTYRAKAKK